MVTVPEQIAGTLEAEWSLGAPLATAQVHFDEGWYDTRLGRDLMPQITVRTNLALPAKWFGGTASGAPLQWLSHDYIQINIWRDIREGFDGKTEEEQVEDMRDEVWRILNEKRTDFSSPITFVIPINHGQPLHELNRTPRLLRWMMLVQANTQRC